MTWFPTNPRAGLPAIGAIVASAAGVYVPVQAGEIITAQDSTTYHGGEFIWLRGVASTAVGSLVTYDTFNNTTTLAPHTANLDSPVAVAMAANTVTTSYAWYQIGGTAVIKRVTGGKTSPSVPLYLSATAGSVQSTASAGKQILNCVTVNAATVASAATTITALINRPFAQGQIT
jgi:hypothetical protein